MLKPAASTGGTIIHAMNPNLPVSHSSHVHIVRFLCFLRFAMNNIADCPFYPPMNTTRTCRICLYCSKPILDDDRVAACSCCFTAHHEECWNRNGRCSTFRCMGEPRTMRGGDLPIVVQAALDTGNEQPETCPFCANRVYPGTLQSKPVHAAGQPNQGAQSGLMFVGKGKPNPHKDWFGKRFLSKMLGNRSWFLPGGHIKSRSCAKCHRLFLWGAAVDDAFSQKALDESGDRFCPHCAVPLWQGQILLNNKHHGGARFECDGIPTLHQDWFGHNVLDRFFLNRWNPTVQTLPARSCPDCQFTEVAGRPIYRFR